MVGVIDGFRWALLRNPTDAHGQPDFWWPSVLTSIVLTTFLCLSGIWYFRKMERTFADVI
jgi:lipopolysaccharide transport system permease protein